MKGALMLDTGHPDAGHAGWSPDPLPSRVFVRCYRSYQDAKRAYDQLRVVARIPDKEMTVVARGLRWREPLKVGKGMRLGALAGAIVAGLAGLILWSLGFTDAGTAWSDQTIVALVAGALAGGAAGAAWPFITRRSLDVPETGHVDPAQYDILVEEDHVPAAEEALADG
jgi:hypothetical protein